MSIRGARELSVPVVLALLGAVMSVGSLLMHWFEIDLAQIEHWMQTSPALANARAQSNLTPEQMHAAMQVGMNAAMERAGGAMAGYRTLSVPSVVAQVAGGLFVVAAVVRFMNEGTSRAQLRVELAVAGALLLFRPLWAMKHVPGGGLEELLGGSVFKASTGLYVALIGAVLVLLAAAMAQMAAGADRAEDDAAQCAIATTLAGRAPTPSYAQAAAPMAAPPAPYGQAPVQPAFGQPGAFPPPHQGGSVPPPGMAP